jgi:hypothetical protein
MLSDQFTGAEMGLAARLRICNGLWLRTESELVLNWPQDCFWRLFCPKLAPKSAVPGLLARRKKCGD